MNGVIKKALVMPSGTMVAVAFNDDQGAPTVVTGITTATVQSVRADGAGGTFTLSFNGQTTAAIRAGALASEVQSALEALSTIGAGNVAVTGAGPWRVEFTGTLATTAQPAITIDGTLLTADPPTVPTTDGTTATLHRGTLSGGASRSGAGWANSGYQPAADGNLTWYTVTAGASTNWLSVSIPGLAAGNYALWISLIDPAQIAANFPSGWTPATNARFRFYDGATLDGTAVYRGEATVDLTWHDEPTTTGSFRKPLASVYCSSGTLWAVLADDADAGGGVAFSFLDCEPPSDRFYGPNPSGWPLADTDRTIALWFTAPTADGTHQPCLFSYGLRSSGTFIELYLDATNHFTFRNARVTLTGTNALTAGQTYLAIFLLDQDFANIYMDGTKDVFVGSTGCNTTLDTTNSGVTFGWSNGSWFALDPFNGVMTRAGVWNRALTDAETATLYNGGVSQPYASLDAGLQSGIVSYYDALDARDGTDQKSLVPLTSVVGAEPVGTAPATADTIVMPGGCPVSISRDGGAAEALDIKVIWGDYDSGNAYKRLPYALFPVPGTPITADQTITVTLNDGAMTVAAGTVAGATGIPALNLVGAPALPTEPPATRQMRVGYNIAPDDPASPTAGVSNLMKLGGGTWGGGPLDDRQKGLNSDGYPTLDYNWWHAISDPDIQILPTGYPSQPWGDYTVVWDGGANCYLSTIDADHTSPVEQTAKAVITGTTDNVRVFTYTFDSVKGHVAPQIYLNVRLNGGTISNVRVYPPGLLATSGVPPAGGWDSIPTFNPEYVSRLAGCKTLRTMSWNDVNGYTLIDMSDFSGPNSLNWGGGGERGVYASVTKLEAYNPGTYGPGSFGAPGFVYLKATTAAPHGFRSGLYVNLFPETGTTDTAWTNGNAQYTFTANDGSGQTLYCWVNGAPIFVIDDTTFVYPLTANDSNGVARTFDPVTPNLMTAKGWSGNIPIDVTCDLVNALEDCDLWWNMPYGVSDATVPLIAQALAANLAPGRRIIYEFSNEPWNIGFAQRVYATVAGANDASGQLTPEQWHARRSAETWRAFNAAWQGAGRSEPVLHVLNAQFGNPAEGQAVIDYITNRDDLGRPSTDPNYSGPIHIDGICTAPYWNVEPLSANLPVANYDALTLEQTMDIGDMQFRNVAVTPLATNAQAYLNMVETYDPTCHLFGYEGGPGYCGLGGTEAVSDLRSMAWTFHPRTYGQQLAALTLMEGAVSSGGQVRWETFCQYQCDDMFRPEHDPATGTNYPKNYGTFKGLAQKPGRGDGSDGLMNNLPELTDTNGMAKTLVLATADGAGGVTPMVSVVGGAFKDWNAGVTATSGGGGSGHGVIRKPRGWIPAQRQRHRPRVFRR